MRYRPRAVGAVLGTAFCLLIAPPAAGQSPGDGAPETHPSPLLSTTQLQELDLPNFLPLGEWAGVYADSLSGTMRVTFEGGTLRLAWEDHPGFTARLEPRQHDSFRLVDWESAGVLAPLASVATFRLDQGSRPAELEISKLGTFGAVREQDGSPY